MTLDPFESNDHRKVMRSSLEKSKIIGLFLTSFGIIGIALLPKVSNLIPHLKSLFTKEDHAAIDQYGYIILLVISIFIVFELIKNGLIYILAMRTVIIDNKEKSITLVERKIIKKTKIYPIENFNQVMLDKKVVKSSDSSIVYYPVKLLTGDGESVFIEEDEQDYLKARFLASRLGQFLHLQVADYGTETQIIREPENIQETLYERLQRTGEKREIREVADPQVIQEVVGKKLILTFPSGVSRFFGVLVFVLTVLFALPLVPLLTPTSVEDMLVNIPVLIFFLIVIRGCFWIGYMGNFKQQVHISPDVLEVHSHQSFIPFAINRSKRKIDEIPKKELRELIIAQNSVVIISDKVFVDVAGNLRKEEQEWVMAVIENAVVS